MKKTRFGLIGSGWRALFYIRIAKALSDDLEISSVLIRDKQKGEAFAREHGVKVVNSLDELLAESPEFVVLSIKRGFVTDMLITLFEKEIPVLCETPPGETYEAIDKLLKYYKEHKPKVQVAEQYIYQPLYMAWKKAISQGKIGDVENINISALHGYHGIAMIRHLLGVGFEDCTIHGKRFAFDVTDTYGRDGMIFDGKLFKCTRDRATIEYKSGKVAFFDFSDPAQYHSFIRTRQLGLQGTRGEIDDLTIRYLSKDNIPVNADLKRVDLGVYGNQEWSHYAIMLGEEFLYQNPFGNVRLNDDELAVATCLTGMKDYIESGKEVYSFTDALFDMYVNLKLEEAYKNPYHEIEVSGLDWE